MSNGYEYILSNYKKPPGYIGESCSRIVAQWETYGWKNWLFIRLVLMLLCTIHLWWILMHDNREEEWSCNCRWMDLIHEVFFSPLALMVQATEKVDLHPDGREAIKRFWHKGHTYFPAIKQFSCLLSLEEGYIDPYITFGQELHCTSVSFFPFIWLGMTIFDASEPT